jgi:hypothetical protein
MHQPTFVNLSGTYTARGFDQHDGAFEKRVHLSLDEKTSDFARGYVAYTYYSEIDGTVLYRGSMLANGNQLSLGFKSEDPTQNDDGLALGVVSHDPDKKGAMTTILHFFYHQPVYQGGGKGSVVCIKLQPLP